jgi:hypothetical protein
MRTVILPGQGHPTTFTTKESTQITVLTGGKFITVPLPAGQVTRIEFIDSLRVAA